MYFDFWFLDSYYYRNYEFCDRIKHFSITAGTKKYKSIILKKKKGHGKIVLLAKSKLNSILSKCAVCDSKISKVFKQHEARGLLSSLGIKTPLIEIPLVGPLLFS